MTSGKSTQTQQGPPPSGESDSGKVRRVVTGLDVQGRSMVISDELVDLGEIWKTSTEEPLGLNVPPGDNSAGVQPTTAPQVDPPPGGSRLLVAAFPPSIYPKPDLNNRRGFHRSSTIDYITLLDGEVFLLLDVQEVKLRPGDVLIIRNTFHSWRNEGTRPARFMAVVVKVS